MPSSHAKRWMTGLSMLGVLALVLYLGGPALVIAVMPVALLGQLEFLDMFMPKGGLPIKAMSLAVGAALVFAGYVGRAGWISGMLTGGVVCLAMYSLFAYARSRDPEAIRRLCAAICSLVYVPLILQWFLALTRTEIVLVLLVCAATDTGAYYGGSWFGRAKLWPAISPKKTWAGAVAGLCVSAGVATAFGLAFGAAQWWAWLALGGAMSVAAQFGDLFESALKRSCEVKDSGRILPGHGGVLDRVDGALFALPLYALLRGLYPFFT